MAKNGGGPAFPRPASEYTESGSCADGNDPIKEQDGMSLRDYFAAKAMHAELVTTTHEPSADALVKAAVLANHSVEQHIAFNAYKLADAMLAERDKA